MRVLSLSTHPPVQHFLELHRKNSVAAFCFSTTKVDTDMFKTYKKDTNKD